MLGSRHRSTTHNALGWDAVEEQQLMGRVRVLDLQLVHQQLHIQNLDADRQPCRVDLMDVGWGVSPLALCGPVHCVVLVVEDRQETAWLGAIPVDMVLDCFLKFGLIMEHARVVCCEEIPTVLSRLGVAVRDPPKLSWAMDTPVFVESEGFCHLSRSSSGSTVCIVPGLGTLLMLKGKEKRVA